MTVPAVLLTAANHYLSRGLSKPAACGIPLVLYYGESKLLTGNQPGTAHTDTGGILWPNAGGIASWNGGRQALLKAFCDRHHLTYTDLTAQLDFVLAEIWNPPGYPAVKAAIQSATTTVQQMIAAFVQSYERPAAPAPEIARAEAGISELMSDPGLNMTVAPIVVLPIPPTVAPGTPPAPIPPLVSLAPLPAATAPPTSLGVTLMDPTLINALAPIVEALAAGLFRALITQLSTTTATVAGTTPAAVLATSAAAAPAVNLASLANELVPMLTSQLGNVLPSLIAAELARLAPTTTTTATGTKT
jgi:hypothetical protein